jgi:CRP-like cAMP-binding protein
MAAKRQVADKELDPIDEVARLLALNLKREHSLQDVIAELDSVGIRQARIAEILGTSPGSVSVALSRTKRRVSKKRSSSTKAKTDQ